MRVGVWTAGMVLSIVGATTAARADAAIVRRFPNSVAPLLRLAYHE